MRNDKEKQTPESIANYVSEGNPNTDKVIERAQAESAQGAPRTAEDLPAKIRMELKKDQSLSGVVDNIGITVSNGIVTLQGSVFSQEQMFSIADKASSVAGRDKISNQIQVTQQP